MFLTHSFELATTKKHVKYYYNGINEVNEEQINNGDMKQHHMYIVKEKGLKIPNFGLFWKQIRLD